jgi:hypothetical protein
MKNYIAPELEIDAVETKDVVTESYYGKVITTTEQVKGDANNDGVIGEDEYIEQKVANVTVGVGGLVNRGV